MFIECKVLSLIVIAGKAAARNRAMRASDRQYHSGVMVEARADSQVPSQVFGVHRQAREGVKLDFV